MTHTIKIKECYADAVYDGRKTSDDFEHGLMRAKEIINKYLSEVEVSNATD